jgi:O-antigen/teichoic acid export membrane protein
MLVVMLVTLYTSRIILSVLGASDYGVYNVVGGVVTIMAFLNGALSASTSRFLTYELGKGNTKRLKQTFSVSLNLHIGVAALVVILGETVGLWFFYNKLVIPPDRMMAAFWVYQFSIITTVINFAQVPFSASLISHEKMSIYASVGLYEAFAKLVIAFLITISPIDKLTFYALLLMLNTFIVQSFYIYYTRKKYEECKFRVVKDKGLYKTLLSYSGWDLFGGLASVCQGQGITIVLNMFFGPVVNAARAIVLQVQSAVTLFVTNFLMAARPQVIKRCADQDYEGMYNLAFYSAKFAYLLMFALIIPICFEIKIILYIWLGDNVPGYTEVFAIIILITSLLTSFHTASLMPYHAIGKIKTGNIIGGSMMIIALPISYVLFKLGFQPYWAFIVIFITNITQQAVAWIIIHGYVRYSYKRLLLKVYVPCLLISVIGIIPPMLIIHFMESSWIRLLLLFFTTEIVLAFLVYTIGLTKSERERLHSLIKNKLHYART